MKGICYIIGAGDCGCLSFNPVPGDYVIAADGGYAQLSQSGIKCDLVLGDFDSLGFVPEHPNVIKLSAIKDDTDMMVAVRAGFELGYKAFVIYGGLGGRLDHTLANIQLLSYIAERGGRGYLIGGSSVITAVNNDKICFGSENSGIISVFCLGSRARHVSISGFKYSLDDAELTCSNPMGVSNEFTGAPGSISVGDGTLLIMWSCDNFSLCKGERL